MAHGRLDVCQEAHLHGKKPHGGQPATQMHVRERHGRARVGYCSYRFLRKGRKTSQVKIRRRRTTSGLTQQRVRKCPKMYLWSKIPGSPTYETGLNNLSIVGGPSRSREEIFRALIAAFKPMFGDCLESEREATCLKLVFDVLTKDAKVRTST